jgi:hypothetical protein
MMRISLLAALSLTTAQAATTGAGGPPPAAAVYAKATPNLILQLVKGAGYSASLDSGGDDPVISITRSKGEPELSLVLLKCGSGSCEKVFIYTDYNPDELDVQPTESDISAWNIDNYTQAYINPDDERSITLNDLYYFVGGFTKANFTRWLGEFSSDASDFSDMLNELASD